MPNNPLKALFIAAPSQAVYGSYKELYKRGFLNPPMSLCTLAASVEQAGHQAMVIDAEALALGLDELAARAREFGPSLIGLTATSVDFHMAAQAAAVLKAALPDTPVILGGTHANIFRGAVLETCSALDFACVGDGEHLMVELLEALDGGPGALDGITGLVRRQDGRVVENDPRPLVEDIDVYPFPARHHLENERYYRSVPRLGYRTTVAFMSSRGCPYSCVYCAVKNITNGRRVRLRSAGNVLDELEHIVNGMGITHVAFNDDCLTLNRQRVLEICQGIHDRGLRLTWEGLSRADLVDEDLLRTMRAAGFVRISYGIESGNQRVLDALNKKETLEQIAEAFRITRKAGIVARGSVIFGGPYETRATARDTIRFVNGLKGLDQPVFNVMQPYPGTRIREIALNGEGGISFVNDPERFEDLRRFGSASIRVNDLEPEDLVALQRKAFLSFYLRPRAVLNNFRISGLSSFFQDGWGMLRSTLFRAGRG